MNDIVTAAIVLLGGLTAVLLIYLLIKDEVVGDREYALLGLTEIALIVQLIVGAVALSSTDHDVEGALFISYLVGNLFVLPIGAFWALAERTRAGTGVLLLAVVTALFLEVRLGSIWAGGPLLG